MKEEGGGGGGGGGKAREDERHLSVTVATENLEHNLSSLCFALLCLNQRSHQLAQNQLLRQLALSGDVTVNKAGYSATEVKCGRAGAVIKMMKKAFGQKSRENRP